MILKQVQDRVGMTGKKTVTQNLLGMTGNLSKTMQSSFL